MLNNLDKTVHDNKSESSFCKTSGLKNSETPESTHNRFKIYVVLTYNDLSKAQIYKLPYRVSILKGNEKFSSFEYLTLFKPNEQTGKYHIRKPID